MKSKIIVVRVVCLRNIKNEGPIVEICEIYRHIYREIAEMTKKLYSNEKFRELVKRESYDA